MADRGRDLKVSILSDASRFDLSDPARDLEKLSDKASDGDRSLSKVGDSAKETGRDFGRLSKDVGETADKVDASFSQIAASSKSLDRVDEGADKAGESVKDMSGEIQQEAIEGAASFDGSMQSIADSAQSTVVNALSAFGPLGAGIGVAAAAGFGFFRAQAEKAKQAVSDLIDEMVSNDGKLARSSVLTKLQDFAKDGSLIKLRRQAEDAKIPWRDFVNAMAGDPDAIGRTTRAIEAARNALYAGLQGRTPGKEYYDAEVALERLGKKLGPVTENLDTARQAVDALGEAAPDAITANDALGDSLDGLIDPLTAYQQALQDKADAEKQSVEDTKVTTGEYLDELSDQVRSTEHWAKNLATLARRGVDDGMLDELRRLGPEGAPLVANLAKSTEPELKRWESLMRRESAAAAGEVPKALRDKIPDVTAAARAMRTAAAAELSSRPIVVPVTLDDAGLRNKLRSMRYVP